MGTGNSAGLICTQRSTAIETEASELTTWPAPFPTPTAAALARANHLSCVATCRHTLSVVLAPTTWPAASCHRQSAALARSTNAPSQLQVGHFLGDAAVEAFSAIQTVLRQLMDKLPPRDKSAARGRSPLLNLALLASVPDLDADEGEEEEAPAEEQEATPHKRSSNERSRGHAKSSAGDDLERQAQQQQQEQEPSEFLSG